MKNMRCFVLCGAVLTLTGGLAVSDLNAQTGSFNGLDMNMGTLPRLSDAQTRSISPENFTGEKGKGGMATEGTGAHAARDLGRGWKVSPSVRIEPSPPSLSPRSTAPARSRASG
jgi:hypothetical protein